MHKVARGWGNVREVARGWGYVRKVARGGYVREEAVYRLKSVVTMTKHDYRRCDSYVVTRLGGGWLGGWVVG